MYEVVYGKRGKKFNELQDAVIFAREKALDGPTTQIVTIWDEAGVMISVLSDDANGLTIHRLATWPNDVPCVYV